MRLIGFLTNGDNWLLLATKSTAFAKNWSTSFNSKTGPIININFLDIVQRFGRVDDEFAVLAGFDYSAYINAPTRGEKRPREESTVRL
jgi:hypothetical protein